jgi:hypothetical protein
MNTFHLDTAGFSRGVRELINITGRSAGDLIRQQARLFLKDVLYLTPPRNKHPLSESFAAQRRTGEAAVRRDIRKVFVSVENLHMVKNPTNAKLGKRLRKLSRSGNIAGVQAILRNIGVSNPQVLASAQASVHKGARDKRGRVARGSGHFVLSEASIKSYLKTAQSHVGKWKSGWLACAKHLKVAVPTWISKHSEPGDYDDQTRNTSHPSFTLINSAAKHQISADLQIIETALRIREKNMKAMAERIIASGWRQKRFIR